MSLNFPIRIALFVYSTKPRGSVIHTLELSNALHQLGHDVCIFALDKDGRGFDYSPLCQSILIPASQAPSNIDLLIRQRIREFVNYFEQNGQRLHPFDVYHAQDCISANALALLRGKRKIPHLVRTVHHIEEFDSPYLRDCQDKSIAGPDLCLCVSDRWQQALHNHYGVLAPRVVNGVDPQRFSPTVDGSEADLRKRLGLDGSPIFLTVGGIEPRKNSIRLLQAFAQVLKEYPTAQLIIAGGATLFDYQSYRDEFFSQVHQLELLVGKSLILPGVVSGVDLPYLYRLADAFVFPSIKEGWGLVVLEAIASGIPVIASDISPFTEFLTHDQALLIDPMSKDAISRAMFSVLSPDLAHSLVQHSQSVLDSYTWKISAQMHVQHYQSLLDHSNQLD
ncbi:MAG: MSMEG_0565 family glycosyltransferase [Elainellaceae cyanobacterium]